MPAMLPLEAQRCTRCGRGVADGATFARMGADRLRSRCRDCQRPLNAASSRRWRERRGAAAAAPPAAPPAGRDRALAARYRDHATRDRALAAHALDDWQARRLRRSAETWERLAVEAEAGAFRWHGRRGEGAG